MDNLPDLLQSRPDGSTAHPTALAREAGVSQPSAHAWCRGESVPDPLRLPEEGLALVRQRVGARVLPGLMAAGHTREELAEIGAAVLALRAALPARKKER